MTSIPFGLTISSINSYFSTALLTVFTITRTFLFIPLCIILPKFSSIEFSTIDTQCLIFSVLHVNSAKLLFITPLFFNSSIYMVGIVAVIIINLPPILCIISIPFTNTAAISGEYACISSITTFEYANVEYTFSYPLYKKGNLNIWSIVENVSLQDNNFAKSTISLEFS